MLTCDPSGHEDYTHVCCMEPQTVGELLKKHNIQCTMVWNVSLSLSATAPCSALVEHNMRLIRANGVIKEIEPPRHTPDPSLHKNMKSRKITTKYSAMRHRPYNVQPPSVFGCDEDDKCVSVLYYTDSKNTLRSVLETDGRFTQEGLRFCNGSETASAATTSHIEEFECIVLLEDVVARPPPRSTNSNYQFDNEDALIASSDRLASTCIMEIENDSVTVSSNATVVREPLNIINYSNNTNIFTCLVCTDRLVTHYLDCGHVLCHECIVEISRTNMANRKKCPSCLVRFAYYKPIVVDLQDDTIGLNNEAAMRCRSCTRIKLWVTNCGHLSCKCYSKHCCVCRAGPVSGWLKLFI